MRDIRFLVPNLLTSASIVVGFFSLLATAEGRYEVAVYLLVAALFLDTFDGRLARRLGATSEFGKEMDSFSDSLSFCAAPAFLVQRAVLAPLGVFGILASIAFLLAGVLRLARYNVSADTHAKARRTTGVPTPVGAGYLLALVMMRDQVPVGIGVLVVALMALLMVSRIQLPELQGGGFSIVALAVGAVSYLAVIWQPNWYTVGWWNLWNLVILVTFHLLDRRPRTGLVSS
jgi:CDP-diacylglycerol--serine O-phosphatidyltransferase